MNKADFTKIYRENIKREGAAALLSYLEKSDFFTAPASTRYHLCREGGLCEHSINVFNCLSNRNPADVDKESIAISGLMHDVCKIGFYKVEMRNTKDEHGKWVQVPYYTVDDQLPYGHGEKSVYVVSSFMNLTREESMAIRWHMGGFDDSVKGGSYCISAAFEKYPLALHLHLADLEATYLLEK